MKNLNARVVIFLVGAAIIVMMACKDHPGSSVGLLAEIGERLSPTAGSWRAESPFSSYTPETLFEYINGHAEVYLAYGLRASIAQRYLGTEELGDIVVDVFELATPADAYGVFTHDQDGEEVQIGQGALFRYGWLSFWKGPFFVSIYAEGESDQARKAVLELGQEIAIAIPEEGSPPPIVARLPTAGRVTRSVRYLHHPNILAAHFPLSTENPLRLGHGAVAALGRYQREDQTAHLLLISYDNPATATRAAEAFRENFLEGGSDPVLRSDGWYAIGPVPEETEPLAFVLGAGSVTLAEDILADVEDSTRGGTP